MDFAAATAPAEKQRHHSTPQNIDGSNQLRDVYVKLGKLGKGSFGTVYVVRKHRHKTKYVAKQIDTLLSDKREQMAENEVRMLKHLSHPNVLKYVGDVQECSCRYIVTEYCAGGDLRALLLRLHENHEFLHESDVSNILLQLLQGIYYIHSKKLLHRDIKARNIFLTDVGIVKIGDFGLTRRIKNQDEAVTSICGTPSYFSPELCNKQPYTSKADIWALGVIAVELMTLNHPFNAPKMSEYHRQVKITNADVDIPDPGGRYSVELKAIVLRMMLARQEKDRSTAAELLALPYFQRLMQQNALLCTPTELPDTEDERLNSLTLEATPKKVVASSPKADCTSPMSLSQNSPFCSGPGSPKSPGFLFSNQLLGMPGSPTAQHSVEKTPTFSIPRPMPHLIRSSKHHTKMVPLAALQENEGLEANQEECNAKAPVLDEITRKAVDDIVLAQLAELRARLENKSKKPRTRSDSLPLVKSTSPPLTAPLTPREECGTPRRSGIQEQHDGTPRRPSAPEQIMTSGTPAKNESPPEWVLALRKKQQQQPLRCPQGYLSSSQNRVHHDRGTPTTNILPRSGIGGQLPPFPSKEECGSPKRHVFAQPTSEDQKGSNVEVNTSALEDRQRFDAYVTKHVTDPDMRKTIRRSLAKLNNTCVDEPLVPENSSEMQRKSSFPDLHSSPTGKLSVRYTNLTGRHTVYKEVSDALANHLTPDIRATLNRIVFGR